MESNKDDDLNLDNLSDYENKDIKGNSDKIHNNQVQTSVNKNNNVNNESSIKNSEEDPYDENIESKYLI